MVMEYKSKIMNSIKDFFKITPDKVHYIILGEGILENLVGIAKGNFLNNRLHG
jgi:hypothetical protein